MPHVLRRQGAWSNGPGPQLMVNHHNTLGFVLNTGAQAHTGLVKSEYLAMKLQVSEDIKPPDDANVQLMLKATALDMCPW